MSEEIKKPNEDVESVETLQHNGEKKKTSTWKYILNIAIVLIVSVVAIFLALRNNYKIIINYLLTADYRFVLLTLGLMISYVAIKGFMWFCFARLFTRDYHFHQGLAVEFIGTFYAAVTPGGQGGEVMQAYTYKKQGIPISSAVSALAMNSIVHQILLIIFGLVSFIVKYDFIGTLPSANLGTYGDVTIRIPMWVLTILGFGLNVGYIVIILSMAYFRPFHNFIMGPIITLLSKIRIVKNPDRSRENLRTQIENFKIEIRRLFSNIPFTILISFIFIISMTIKFSIPYFVGLAMGNQSTIANFWDAVFLSNYHQMATGLIPIPGSAGISEFVFNTLFSTSPATPTTSFFFIDATEAQQLEAYNSIITNSANYRDFFRSILKLTSYDEIREISDYAAYCDMNGIAFADANADFKEVVNLLADTRASSSMASAALIMWRFMTFILPLTAAGFVTAFYRASPRKDAESSERMAGRHTLVDLQRETYSERAEMVETMVETSRLNREAIAKRLKALAKSDRRRKKKQQELKEAERQNLADPNEFRSVNVDSEDDSL